VCPKLASVTKQHKILDMQAAAIQCAAQALDEYSVEKDIASAIRRGMSF